jgi:hypothetical protein
MFELLISFFAWYWTSKAWLWFSLILLVSLISCEI